MNERINKDTNMTSDLPPPSYEESLQHPSGPSEMDMPLFPEKGKFFRIFFLSITCRKKL